MRQPVAIVHDWLASMRGSERVVEVLLRVFPRADLFTLTWDPARLSPELSRRNVNTSAIHCIASAPLVRGRFRALLPLFPLAVESFKLDRYALVISSSHCVALGAIAPPGALHVAYIHSTIRYAREAQSSYEASVPGGVLGRALFRGTARYLRRWEVGAAARPHELIANSTYTRERICKYYSRDAQVIEPPIDTRRFVRAAAGSGVPHAGAPFLLVSALVPNKRVDLAIRAFEGRPERLVVVGDGPERARLVRLAGPNVTLLSGVDDARLDALFAGCRALLHTGVDDFGMVMVEALAAGKPVIACAEGGALEIVRDGETGLLIDEPTVTAVRGTLDRFVGQPWRFEGAVLQDFAKRFDQTNFERRFADAVDQAWRRHQPKHPNAHRNGHANGTRLPVYLAAPRLQNWAQSGATETRKDSASEASAVRHVEPPSRANLAVKRFVDVTLAATGLLLTAPMLLALGGLIRLDSPGPMLFRQRRPGLNQQPFTLVKLRTMNENGRVTRMGRLLRPTGLDELPQLWNVLKGDMSLIGPRPEVLERAERFASELPDYRARHLMRPGITGWAQVNGLRGDVPIARRLESDLEYMQEWSFALDARILLRTVSTVWGDTMREIRG